MSHEAFVYTELQNSQAFGEVPWRELNEEIRRQPGFVEKTWLSGVSDGFVGGFYVFDTMDHARRFVTGFFPSEARRFGVAQTSRLFDARATTEASRDMGSTHYGGRLPAAPGAFVYTEVQVNVLPFDDAPWRELNPILKQQPGLMAKTWLSGLHTGTLGGFYAFDRVENAQRFAQEYFPTETAELGAAYTSRVLDAEPVAAASREMGSSLFV